jgi:plasmid stability protein
MTKMLQVRRVPDDVHTELKRRARAAGLSLSDFALRELERAVTRPSIEEVLSRGARRRIPLGFAEARATIETDRSGR